MIFGIIREGKVPHDHRTPLLPEQAADLRKNHPEAKIYAQSSLVRCIHDDEYEAENIAILEDMSHCDVLMGVKEVPISQIIEGKTYMFFSHTMKKQAYNKKLMQAILAKKIRMIDYECLTNEKGERIVAFGLFAGIVGAYNAFWTYGERYKTFQLKRANACKDYEELKEELLKVKLPNIKIALTGRGRVGHGAIQILEEINMKKVSPIDYLTKTYNEPVFTVLASHDYYHQKTDEKTAFDATIFHKNPELFEANFLHYAQQTDILITTHFWNPKADILFSKNDMARPDFRIKIIADISCDVNGSVPCTIRASTIDAPIYDYNPHTQEENELFIDDKNVTVMAVDNLPCELPFDASWAFGMQLVAYVMPHFFNGDAEKVLERATIAQNGDLMPRYEYLRDYTL